MKHWVWSEQSWNPIDGESVKSAAKDRILKLPNQLRDKDIHLYLAEEDKLYIITSINFSKQKKKMRELKRRLGPRLLIL